MLGPIGFLDTCKFCVSLHFHLAYPRAVPLAVIPPSPHPRLPLTNAYHNKSCCTVGQGMLTLQGTNPMECGMPYLERQPTIEPFARQELESVAWRYLKGPGSYPAHYTLLAPPPGMHPKVSANDTLTAISSPGLDTPLSLPKTCPTPSEEPLQRSLAVSHPSQIDHAHLATPPTPHSNTLSTNSIPPIHPAQLLVQQYQDYVPCQQQCLAVAPSYLHEQILLTAAPLCLCEQPLLAITPSHLHKQILPAITPLHLPENRFSPLPHPCVCANRSSSPLHLCARTNKLSSLPYLTLAQTNSPHCHTSHSHK